MVSLAGPWRRWVQDPGAIYSLTDDLRIGLFQKCVQHLVPAVPQPDAPKAGAFVGAGRSRGSHKPLRAFLKRFMRSGRVFQAPALPGVPPALAGGGFSS